MSTEGTSRSSTFLVTNQNNEPTGVMVVFTCAQSAFQLLCRSLLGIILDNVPPSRWCYVVVSHVHYRDNFCRAPSSRARESMEV